MKNKFLFFILSLVAFTPHMALAELRIATVDVNRILNESKEGKSKRAQLDEMTQFAKKKIDAKKSILKNTEEKLKTAGTVEDSKDVRNFKNQVRDFSGFVKDTEEDLRQAFLKVNKDLTDKVIKNIEAYAKNNKIDLVLDKSSQERGAVLFGDNSADISDKIINLVND